MSVQVNSQGKVYVNNGKILLGSNGGGGSTITAVNSTGSNISVGDKVWICKDSGSSTLYLRTFTYIDQYSYTGFAKTSGANGTNIDVETVFPEEITLTLSTTTDDAYLNVG